MRQTNIHTHTHTHARTHARIHAHNSSNNNNNNKSTATNSSFDDVKIQSDDEILQFTMNTANLHPTD